MGKLETKEKWEKGVKPLETKENYLLLCLLLFF